MGTRHCLSRLDAYLEGALGPAAGRRVAEHLASCPDCARIARERAAVLVAAHSVGSLPAASAAVMRPHGVPGRVVVGVLTFLILLCGLLAAVWMAGAPRGSAARAQPQPSDALRLVQGEASGTESALALVADLRAHGWTVPSLVEAGLQPLSVHSTEEGDVVVVAVQWGSGDAQATVRECRSRTAARPPSSCDVTGDDGLAWADTARLPGGLSYRIADADTGWEAAYRTSQAAYRVTSDLPRAQAVPLLTQLVVSERSGLTELPHEDQIGDRIERGLERFSQAVPTGVRVRDDAAGRRPSAEAASR